MGASMLAEIGRHARRGDSFAVETTLSGRRYARQPPRAAGYRVKLYSEDGVIKYEYRPATNESSDKHAAT
ncbi:MAG: hypothetical protein KFB96_11290 [Thiocapsa sp.]|uniref:hypothetical protein n=1 Tax=Thiocapsa sp. TaxID=2024551 RepID=UPI001BCAB1E4|nr:hypothetical protein [Thiocapsa sp.]QVL50928.1 MAG: hypothetical protein KFB96_11290 [Thiocapsa sp.]